MILEKTEPLLKMHPIYPSTLKLHEIYGYEEHGKWVDGVLQRTLKDIHSNQSTNSHWVYFDGAVDDSWVSILQRATSATNKNFAGDTELSLSHHKVFSLTTLLLIINQILCRSKLYLKLTL